MQDNNTDNKVVEPVESEEVKAEPVAAYIWECARLASLQTTKPDELRPICFHQLGGSVVFGLCFVELKDSFLAGLVTKLVREEGVVDGKMVISRPVMRIFKNSIAYASSPDPEHTYYYYRSLIPRFDNAAEIFTEKRREEIEQFVYNYETANNIKKQTAPVSPVDEQEQDFRDKFDISESSFLAPYHSREKH